MLSSDESRIIGKAKFTYSPLGKAVEKQTITTDDQGVKEFESLKALKSEKNNQEYKSIEGIFPKDMRTNEIKYKIDEIRKLKEKFKRKDLKYETKKTHI